MLCEQSDKCRMEGVEGNLAPTRGGELPGEILRHTIVTAFPESMESSWAPLQGYRMPKCGKFRGVMK